MKSMPHLIAARILFRPFAADDASAVDRLAGVHEVADTARTQPHPYSAGCAADTFANRVAWSYSYPK